MAEIRVRPATVADAAPLAAFAERTFRETFAADNTPEDMAAYLATAFGEAIQRAELLAPDTATIVAEADGTLAGYAMMRLGRDAEGTVLGEAPIELQRLYVDRAFKGQGLAQRLMEHVEEEARRRGARTLWLGVWEKNPRAIAFYEKCGFTDVGTHVFRLGRDAQTDRLMQKVIPAAS